MEAHFRPDLVEGCGPEMGRAHPGLDCSEGMLDGSAADTHVLGRAIQSLLHGVNHCFMFPAPDAALLAGGALVLECASSAVGSPIFVDVQTLLDRGEAPGQSLAGGAAIDVVIGDIDEVLLAEASIGLGA